MILHEFGTRKFFSNPSRVILCVESIARIPEAQKNIPDPGSAKK
jgi:hypothetical protein